MAIGHISYKDVPLDVRRHAAERTRRQIRTLMTTNFVTQDQMTFLNHRLKQLDEWEKGLIPGKMPLLSAAPPEVLALPPAEHQSVHHTVDVDDDLIVVDGDLES